MGKKRKKTTLEEDLLKMLLGLAVTAMATSVAKPINDSFDRRRRSKDPEYIPYEEVK